MFYCEINISNNISSFFTDIYGNIYKDKLLLDKKIIGLDNIDEVYNTKYLINYTRSFPFGKNNYLTDGIFIKKIDEIINKYNYDLPDADRQYKFNLAYVSKSNLESEANLESEPNLESEANLECDQNLNLLSQSNIILYDYNNDLCIGNIKTYQLNKVD